ncbi:DUF917 domain-containing protein [Edaphobacillus lindanitolerans]|uniref:DUF917 domain-containing protein n=1 Tax=Edaphobacillus lindanitolerans TaxID=550447 RepID=A0A1U7PMZ6_9BACI|nr:DUF917 domain-containing protein [Edaphobacillus lindanitolerans]SIT72914.1 hypothetical protein SAMN05428946_0917 [Edaphobacillus lindanitolerans]
MPEKMNRQQAEDILFGACILGAGGGGSLSEGLGLIKRLYGNGRSVQIVDVEDVGDNWLVVSPYYVGSVAPPTKEAMDKLSGISEREGNPSVFATRALEEYLGCPVDGICATELGGNTAWAMDVAAEMNLPLVDGDPAGRAVPDLAHTSFNVHGASITPFALANRYGEHLIVQSVANHDRADQIARSFAMNSGNFSGICDHPLNGKRFKEVVIPGTLSRAKKIGGARRNATEMGKNPIEAIVEADEGWLIVSGTIMRAEWVDANGFIEGEVLIRCHKTDRIFAVNFLNENMTVECNGNLIGIIPDILSILDAATGMPILNPSCREGMEVALIRFTSPEIWTTAEGMAVFGPRYIGREIEEYFRCRENSDNGLGKEKDSIVF